MPYRQPYQPTTPAYTTPFDTDYSIGQLSDQDRTLAQTLRRIERGHVQGEDWYRAYRRWAEYNRELAGAALGTQGRVAIDPLARLQQQLQQQYDSSVIPNAYAANTGDFGRLIGAQQRSLQTALMQRAAGMGVNDAYSGVLATQARARQTLASQSMAAYRPQAWIAQQGAQAQEQQLLNSLAQAQGETERSIMQSGRNA